MISSATSTSTLTCVDLDLAVDRAAKSQRIE